VRNVIGLRGKMTVNEVGQVRATIREDISLRRIWWRRALELWDEVQLAEVLRFGPMNVIDNSKLGFLNPVYIAM
jgi:hypothetical protein